MIMVVYSTSAHCTPLQATTFLFVVDYATHLEAPFAPKLASITCARLLRLTGAASSDLAGPAVAALHSTVLPRLGLPWPALPAPRRQCRCWQERIGSPQPHAWCTCPRPSQIGVVLLLPAPGGEGRTPPWGPFCADRRRRCRWPTLHGGVAARLLFWSGGVVPPAAMYAQQEFFFAKSCRIDIGCSYSLSSRTYEPYCSMPKCTVFVPLLWAPTPPPPPPTKVQK